MREKLETADYRVEDMTHYMTTLFPAMWLGRRLAALRTGLDGGEEQAYNLAANELRVVPVVNDVLNRLMSWETVVVRRRWSMPLARPSSRWLVSSFESDAARSEFQERQDVE